MIRETVQATLACLITLLLCAGVYPVAAWGLAQLAFPHQAQGSLIYGPGRTVVGSELIAQPFASEKYFFPRPSAADYKADAASGSNLATTNPDLAKKVAERAEAFKATAADPVPVDLVTASGAGLDPDITVEGARYQAPRVAAARKLPVGKVRELIAAKTDHSGSVLGAPPRVNVLQLNLALDEIPASEAETAASPSAPAETPAEPAVEALNKKITDFAADIERMSAKINALPEAQAASEKTREEVKRLESQISKLLDATRQTSQLVERLDSVSGRVSAAEGTLQRLRQELQTSRKAIATPAAARTR